ncbi:hypothetical protein DXG03_008749 [Asterophora parasitica]|uniref:Cytochrome P450 n=1 Tax=Asterophora parasitica TaxID=117018 RepID=A0A9P7KCK9_9AGAR|nr:hypothetical protein DXG03_008749 [Asterophora parasitica]
MAGETIISIAYGLDVKPKNDFYIATAEKGIAPLLIAGVPGTFLVDTFPFLKYVPSWMPGAGFRRKAKEWRKLALDMANVPYEAAITRIKSGNFTPSFTSYSLDNMDEKGDLELQEYVIKSTAGSMYAAGSDSTVSALASCILGLLQNPEVLKKAQQEVDSVVGLNQLPSFDEESSLPYITAIVMETLRWREVTPIGEQAMLHDEKEYPDPFTFNPDRFMKDGKLNGDTRDPSPVAFGFGRR